MWTFKTDWWDKLMTAYIKENDTYKVDTEGLLQRFIKTLGEELDDNTVQFIQDFSDNLTPLLSSDGLTTHLAYTMGRPPHQGLTEEQFKYLLSISMTIYKWKGTTNSYKALFLLLGYYIEIFTDPTEDVLYDNGEIYDSGILYDTYCETCVPYFIMVAPVTDDPEVPEFTPISAEDWANLLELVEGLKCWLEPINADFQGLVRTLFIKEEVEPQITEDGVATHLAYTLYDTGLLYDDGEEYDDVTETITTFV